MPQILGLLGGEPQRETFSNTSDERNSPRPAEGLQLHCRIDERPGGLFGVEEQLGVLDEQVGILEVGAVVGVGIEDELCIGSVLLEQV